MPWLVRLIVVLVSLVTIAASMAMNLMFLTSLGKSAWESAIFGCVSVAIDGLKALTPIVVRVDWDEGRRLRACLGGALFLSFLTFGFISALGYAAENRGHRTGGRENMATNLRVTEDELRRVEGARAALGSVRLQALVESELRALKLEALWDRTRQCTDMRGNDSRALCRRHEALQREVAGAAEHARLTAKIDQLRREAAALRTAMGGREVDQQASLLAHLTGVAEAAVRDGLAVAIAVVVELGSSFGLFLAGRGAVLPAWLLPRPVLPRIPVRRRGMIALRDADGEPDDEGQETCRRRRR